MLPWGYSQLTSHFSSCLLPGDTFSTFMIPLPPRIQIKALWSTSSLDSATAGARQAIRHRPAQVLPCAWSEPVLLGTCSLTKVASLLKEECHRKGCDCAQNAWAVCLPLASGLPVGPGARLPGASFNCLPTQRSLPT